MLPSTQYLYINGAELVTNYFLSFVF